MTDPDDRRRRIEAAEDMLGARLPPLCRSALIADGQASFDLGDGQFLDLWLAPEGQGTHIFAHCDGVPITEMGGWDGYAENWHLQENAFLVAFNGCGDYFLLLPDEAGIARRVVFADHEIGELSVICADLEAHGLGASPQRRDARAALLA
ncbi:MAG: hypothetical protein EP318_02595 [Rhodobacteraceae bacterium]|nr:MAG: hypothetical protein EP318_02595 [Paracoccaceae bacterium]